MEARREGANGVAAGNASVGWRLLFAVAGLSLAAIWFRHLMDRKHGDAAMDSQPDPTTQYAAASDTETSSASPWRVVAASVCGTGHRRRDLPCQDASRYAYLPTGQLVVAVSDGAGTARRAQQGSAFIAEQAISELKEIVATRSCRDCDEWRDALREAFASTRRALEAHACDAKGDLRDYAATLILVVVDETQTVCALVGDCAAVALDAEGALHSLCAPQRGEYANTTFFLTQPRALEQLEITVLEGPIRGVAVFTDGLLNLATVMAENRPHPGFFLPLLRFALEAEDMQQAQPRLAQFLDSERVNARTDDDKTLVLCMKHPQSDGELPQKNETGELRAAVEGDTEGA